MNELAGKVAIVTGASTAKGIGRAIARRFAKAGGSLLLVADQTMEQLEDARRECQDLNPEGNFVPAIVDLGKAGQPEAMVARAVEAFGRVDVLVNNAGIRAPYNFGEFTREIFDRMISVNVAAAFFASQAVLPIMQRQGGGRILHIASQLGQVASPQDSLYGLTKAALIHLTKSMAGELSRDNIVVNCLSPGPIATDPLRDRGLRNMRELYSEAQVMTQDEIDSLPTWNADKGNNLPIGRLGTPEEVAEVALFLAASSPAFLLGQDIVVDGGYVTY